MPRHVLGLEELDRSQVAIAGGKGANLGELLRVEGVRVPAGFCVTTAAFDTVAQSPENRRDPELIRIPDDLATHITDALEHYGATLPYAVRSSATTEDLPSASFAGQHDSYLNVVGPAAILEHVSRCWASLFTERAVAYRLAQRHRPPRGRHGGRRAADGRCRRRRACCSRLIRSRGNRKVTSHRGRLRARRGAWSPAR